MGMNVSPRLQTAPGVDAGHRLEYRQSVLSAERRITRNKKSDLVAQIRVRLLRAAQRLGRDATRKLEVRGISQAQLELMRRIGAQPDETQQNLVRQLGVTRGNVSQLLSKLEAEELVSRNAFGTRKALRLTRKGERFLESVLPAEEELLGSRFEKFSKSELEQFLMLLEKLEV
jgi:DNA-binding MarR family transcriptional regulator